MGEWVWWVWQDVMATHRFTPMAGCDGVVIGDFQISTKGVGKTIMMWNKDLFIVVVVVVVFYPNGLFIPFLSFISNPCN